MYRDAYLETEILSASPMRLVELLYRGAMDACRKAADAITAGDIAARNHQITRAQAILTELSLSLDHAQGGALSRELAELYDYMQRRLNQANADQTREPLEDVRRLLETLLEAWTSISSGLSVDALTPQMSTNQAASQFGTVDFEGSRINSLG